LEKILLINSFLDTFQRIILVGEVAISALHSLGIKSGCVERIANNTEEYDQLTEFWLKIFDKSIEKQCAIIFPSDFVIAEKDTID
jgi:3-phosphoglycerate kinase